MKYLITVLAVLLLASCFSCSSPTVAPDAASKLVAPVLDRLTLVESKTSGGAIIQQEKLNRAAIKTQVVINSPEFKARVLKATFTQTKFSSAEVLKRLLEGAEFYKVIDYKWQFVISLERLPNKTLGSTPWYKPMPKNPVPLVKFNTYKFDTRVERGLVGTLCHEKMHQLGFTHNVLATRSQSVPYSMGTICAEVFRVLEGARKL